MVGIGEPKEAQCSNAGLLVMTWYTWLGGVRTLGGSALKEKQRRCLVKLINMAIFQIVSN